MPTHARLLLATVLAAAGIAGCTRLPGAALSGPPSGLPASATAPTSVISSNSSTAPQGTAAAGPAATAQEMLLDLLASQPRGKAVAAAYVVSTLGEYEGALPPESRLSALASPSDEIVVVKVFGTFPDAHRGPIGPSTDATTIIEVFDITTGMTVETTFMTGPESADLPGAPAAATPVYADLRQLGTPVALKL